MVDKSSHLNSVYPSWFNNCGYIEMGGFGMISYGKIIDGIKCRQLCKLFDPSYYHPLNY
jgi:hypothetical protein